MPRWYHKGRENAIKRGILKIPRFIVYAKNLLCSGFWRALVASLDISSPNDISLAVLELAHEDNDPVDDPPDTEAPESDEHENPGADFPVVEAMSAEATEEEPKE